MTELEMDLEKIARCDGIFLPKFVAARLVELGYVKVVRCGECVHWQPCDCPACRRSEDPVMVCGNPDLIYSEGIRGGFEHCGRGERVVAKSATAAEITNEKSDADNTFAKEAPAGKPPTRIYCCEIDEESPWYEPDVPKKEASK